jgi:hypothetical protein
MAKELKSGASVPMANRAEILVALNGVAASHGVDPAAIAGIIHTESGWNSKDVTGSYIGLTQVGPEFLTKLGLTKKQFLDSSAGKQIEAYGAWQAKVLGDTSIGDMEKYYGGFFKKRPPVYG